MALRVIALTDDEWRVLLEAHDRLKQWMGEHRAALELLDAAERDVLHEAVGLLDPLRVQRHRTIAMHAATEAVERAQRQAAGEHKP
jgi:hypothetical protein